MVDTGLGSLGKRNTETLFVNNIVYNLGSTCITP